MLSHQRFNSVLAVAAVATVAGPVAVAGARIELNPPTASQPAPAAAPADHLRSPEPSPAAAAIRAHRLNHAAVLSAAGAQQSPVVQLVGPQASSGFDWGDAGIGAASMVAIALLLAGGVMVATRWRGHHGGSGPSALAR